MVWAVPVSLAATKGIARTFFLILMELGTTLDSIFVYVLCRESHEQEAFVTRIGREREIESEGAPARPQNTPNYDFLPKHVTGGNLVGRTLFRPLDLSSPPTTHTSFFRRALYITHNFKSKVVPSARPERKSLCVAFFSSSYCDVSLHWVRSLIQGFLPMTGGFPHSDISGSKVDWHLAETYRSHSTSFIAS